MGSKVHTAGMTPNQRINDREVRDDVPAVAAGSVPSLVSAPTDDSSEKKMQHGDWLELARDAFETGDDYFDSSIRPMIERNLAHFNNRHAPGSKYYSDLYKFRARGFRPKTRSVVRKNEAKLAIALFSTADVASISPEDDQDPAQVVSAELNKRLLKYRLDNTIPWFQTALGAYQDTLNSGIVVSHNYWNFEEVDIPEVIRDERGETVIDNETGEDAIGVKRVITKDTPAVDLRPIENIRFSPAADWADPVNSSPYFIDMIPMTIGEVKQKAKQTKKTRVKWLTPSTGMLQKAHTEYYDGIRQQREHKRQDSKDQTHQHTDFDNVWVHRNILRKDGLDYLVYTLGTYEMLSEPILLFEEYPHLKPGERPYTLGNSIIETHKTYPESVTGLGASLQQEANDINNQRRDNVALVLNRRYYARRGAQIDYRSLVRNIPGSVTEMEDITRDIRSEAPPEVTGSSYQEQDRVNMDFDELAGSFSSSSVGSNRQLNETVGGMEMLSGTADDITEYQMRTFVATWLKNTIKHLVRLEQRHETDAGILKMLGKKAKLWQRFGVDQVTDSMIQGNMSIEIDVGFGSMNPKQRIEKIVTAVDAVVGRVPGMALRMDGDAVSNAIMGAAGYDGSERFFPPVDPNNPPQQQEDPKIATEKIRAKVKTMELEQHDRWKKMDWEYKIIENEKERELKLEQAEISLEKDILKSETSNEISDKSNKIKLADRAITERNANERFKQERKFAETDGDGRGL
jgi:hypothetical protein